MSDALKRLGDRPRAHDLEFIACPYARVGAFLLEGTEAEREELERKSQDILPVVSFPQVVENTLQDTVQLFF